MPILTIGDIANRVGEEIKSLKQSTGSKFMINDIQLCKINLPKKGRLWKYNLQFEELILDQIRHCLQEGDNMHTLLILYSDRAIHGTAAIVLNILHDCFPSIQLNCIYLPLSETSFTGLECLDEIRTHQYALAYSNYFSIRSIQETLHFITSRGLILPDSNHLNLVYQYLSSDFFLLYINCIKLFGILPASFRSKCCDFRSSFWRSLSTTSKKMKEKESIKINQKEDVNNKYRDMSINLHNLFEFSSLSFPDIFDTICYCEIILYGVYEQNNQVKLHLRTELPSSVISNELKVILEWATPGMNYSIFDSSIQTLKKSDGLLNRIRDSSTLPVMDNKAVGFLFESSYIKNMLRLNCSLARDILNSGAYAHTITLDGYSVDDILDAIAAVHEYTTNSI